MRHSSGLWIGALICILAPATSYTQVYPDMIKIAGSSSLHAPTCAKFASACTQGGFCTAVVFTGKIRGNVLGKANAEIDLASSYPDLAVATLDEEGCTTAYLDICYSIKSAPVQEIVAQLSQCLPVEDRTEAAGKRSVAGVFQLIRADNKWNGWGRVNGVADFDSARQTLHLTLSGLLEYQ
jgi:hypothetical protein